MVKPGTRKELVEHVLTVIGFDKEARDYLATTRKIFSYARLVSQTDELIQIYINESGGIFSHADGIEIKKLISWDQEFKKKFSKGPDSSEVKEIITEEFWDCYRPSDTTDENISDSKLNLQVSTGRTETVEKSSTTKVDFKSIPEFNGKINNWAQYERLLEAYTSALGLGDLLDDTFLTPDEDSKDYETYEFKNKRFYDILQYSTAKGTAYTKIKPFKKKKDGVLAYKALRDWYDGQGCEETKATRGWNNLHTLILHKNSNYGMDGYISRYEKAIQDLDDVGEIVSEKLRKTILLKGIKDDYYKAAITTLKMDSSKKSEACVNELQKIGIDYDTENSKRSSRNANSTSTDNKSNSNSTNKKNNNNNKNQNDKWVFLPKEAWNAMTNEQKKVWTNLRQANSRKSKQNNRQDNQSNNLPNQYSNSRNNNSTTENDEDDNQNSPKNNQSDELPNGEEINDAGKKWLNYTLTNAHALRTVNIDNSKLATVLNMKASKPTDGILIIDGGCDTTVCGIGWKIISQDPIRKANLIGYSEDKTDQGIPIGSAITATNLPNGDTILLQVNEAVLLSKNKNSLLSCQQVRDFGIQVNDVPRKYGGSQNLHVEQEGISIPFSLNRALLTKNIRVPTDHELQYCEVINLTNDQVWDPEELNDNYEGEMSFINKSEMTCVSATEGNDKKENQDNFLKDLLYPNLNATRREVEKLNPENYKRYLGWIPNERIIKTFENSTQHAKNYLQLPLKKHFKSRFPVLNRPRLTETYCTDTFFSSTPGIGGINCAQVFVGKSSNFGQIYGMKSESQGSEALEEFISEIGAPHHLHSDNAQMETSKTWKNILRKYNISSSTTEPRNPQQNYAERMIQEYKKFINLIMDRTGTPNEYWMYAAEYVVYLLNHMSVKKLKWKTPIEAAFGYTPDISALLQFSFWENVYYYDPDATSFPTTKENVGHFLGISKNCGDALTFYVLTANEQIISRSVLRTAEDNSTKNLRAELNSYNSEGSKNRIQAGSDFTKIVPDFDVKKFIGFHLIRNRSGTPHKAEVTRFDESEQKFFIEYANGTEEMVDYDDLVNCLNRKNEEFSDYWAFQEILDHRTQNGIREVKVLWDTGEVSWEPMDVIRKDDPVTLAKYAKDKNLENQAGWKWAKRYTKNQKKFIRLVKIMKSQKKNGPKFKFGIQVPRSMREALELDRANGNNFWKDAIDTEISQQLDYDVFKDLPKGQKPPRNYTFVPLHMCFDVKFDLRRKARLVAGGNWTDPGYEDVYSGVVSIETIRLGFFLAALNGLDICAADVGNAFLHGITNEFVYSIAGPEFGPKLQGRVLIIKKSLYGLRTSAARWHEHFTDSLRTLGFTPSKADPDMYMKDMGTHYEYISMYVDDILIFSKNPLVIVNGLKALYILKGVGKPEYYLGGDVEEIRVEGSIRMVLSSKTYIRNICEKIEKLFELVLHKYNAPMDEKYHPELDSTELLTGDNITKYRMLIGCGNWAVTLGRYDVHYAISTMARYSHLPRKGHLMATIRIFGYLKWFLKKKVIIDTTIPNVDNLKIEQFNWTEFYPHAIEEIPKDMPEPKGKEVKLSSSFDASHASDLVTRRSVTGVLQMINNTPISSYSKRQNTVESSTYGSELVAARIATDLAVAMRYKLRMLGVPIQGSTLLYGDNLSVITNATLPSSTLKKKHNAIAYHRVREAVASRIIDMVHIPSTENVSDLLTKPLGPQKHYRLMSKFFR